jgi:xanthine dehydrogenase accessory factor
MARTLAGGEPAALGIITGTKGSSPQKIGAKALFLNDGRIVGTLGGGCLEAEIQDRARRALHTGQPAVFELVLDHDFGWDDGLICGGKVQGVILPALHASRPLWEKLAQRPQALTWGIKENFTVGWTAEPDQKWLYQETVHPPCTLWIAGAGHIAQAVAPWALELDFAVTVFDDRAALANHHFFPEEVTMRTGEWSEGETEVWPATPTFGLIMTRGHRHDAVVLRSWIHRPFAFLGMIGSARKARTIREHFVKEKIATAEQLARVVCPVGLEIGGQSVKEIAISILSQYIQKRAEVLGVALLAQEPLRPEGPDAEEGGRMSAAPMDRAACV